MKKVREEIEKIVFGYLDLSERAQDPGELIDKITSLITNKESVAEVPCSAELSDLADAWDKAAEHYSVEAEKQPTTYLKGIRAGASYKLESCANELRALIKEAGR